MLLLEREKSKDFYNCNICFIMFRNLNLESDPKPGSCGKQGYRRSRPSDLI